MVPEALAEEVLTATSLSAEMFGHLIGWMLRAYSLRKATCRKDGGFLMMRLIIQSLRIRKEQFYLRASVVTGVRGNRLMQLPSQYREFFSVMEASISKLFTSAWRLGYSSFHFRAPKTKPGEPG